MKNPHDGDFKDLAEDHPELLLRLLGILQPGEKTKIKNILRELRVEPVLIDHAYLMENDSKRWIIHLEAVTSWNRKQINSMVLYQFLLKRQEKIPVISHVIFMAEKYTPKVLPERLIYEDDDGLRIEAPYKVIRLWEIEPALAFETGNEPLLAWVPLLRGGGPEFERAAAAIGQLAQNTNDLNCSPVVLVSKLASLASLRYDKIEIKAFLERLEKKIMLSTDALKISWLYQEGLEEGKAEGKAQGEVVGIAKGKVEAIGIVLNARFPGIDMWLGLDRINDPKILDELLASLFIAKSVDEVGVAISLGVEKQNQTRFQ